MTLVSAFAPAPGTQRLPRPADAAVPGRATVRLYASRTERLLRGAGLVVTPNLDHLRLLTLSKAFRHAYAQADVVVNDSRFLDRLALEGRAACLPGSELAPMMLDAAPPGSRVLVIGGDRAVHAHLTGAYPDLDITVIEPSMGYVRKRGERRALARAVLAAEPDYVFVCTGAPQSELMAAQLKRAGCKASILCCGSAFHFLTGARPRAPEAFRLVGAEWAWRFVGEPHTRKRYLADALFLARNLAAFLQLRTAGRAAFGAYVLQAD